MRQDPYVYTKFAYELKRLIGLGVYASREEKFRLFELTQDEEFMRFLCETQIDRWSLSASELKQLEKEGICV
jgi:hypothetical protein